MNDNYNGTLGDAIFAGIEKNEYLNELYEAILFNYSISLFHVTDVSRKEIDIEDSLRFADILSKSTSLKKADMHKTFKWEKYEPQTLGKLSSTGGHALLKWYAVILVQWISGAGLSNIINRAIQYKEDNPESGVMINGKIEKYDGTDAHKNIVISDTLKVIENTILFSISNYFLRFSNEYKIQHPNEIFQDWYEYVEYGTTNPLTITLQRSGFSREASTYIRQHRTDYVTGTNEQPKLRKTLLKCSNISIRKETVDILYNMPELFVD